MAIVKPGEFTKELMKQLKSYSEDVQKEIEDIADDMADRYLSETKAASREAYPGRDKKPYWKGWKKKVEKGRNEVSVAIHHSYPGMPHLLNNGHAMPQGGRFEGRDHLSPLQEEMSEEFERRVEEALEDD